MSALLYPLPETPAEVVRAMVLEDLARITSFPVTKPENPNDHAYVAQERRKYLAEPEPITAMGDLT